MQGRVGESWVQRQLALAPAERGKAGCWSKAAAGTLCQGWLVRRVRGHSGSANKPDSLGAAARLADDALRMNL
jgi:hypothetical protein